MEKKGKMKQEVRTCPKTLLSKERAHKYISLMEKWDKKEMKVKDLSLLCGVVEDAIANELAYFDPLIRLFPEYNILLILDELKKKYLTKKTKSSLVKKEPALFDSIADFIYKNMTEPGGLVDKNVKLNKEQLKTLKKLINDELKK